MKESFDIQKKPNQKLRR